MYEKEWQIPGLFAEGHAVSVATAGICHSSLKVNFLKFMFYTSGYPSHFLTCSERSGLILDTTLR